MSSTTHPSYVKPTLQEAICEIDFSLGDGVQWESQWFADFYARVREEFPVFEPFPVPGFQISFGQHALEPPQVLQVVRYRDEAKSLFIQLSERHLVINKLPQYLGWENMIQNITYAWEAVLSVVHPAQINRIVLRYINRIERSSRNETLGEWFRESDFVPLSILKSQPGLGSNMLVHTDDHNIVNVMIGEHQGSTDNSDAFIFDIASISTESLALETSQVVERTNMLHNVIWDVFEKAKGDKLERLLRGELL